MRWSRGLFRLWLVLSVVWVLGAGTGSLLLYEPNPPISEGPWTKYQKVPSSGFMLNKSIAPDPWARFRLQPEERFEVTAPDGRKFMVTRPHGLSQSSVHSSTIKVEVDGIGQLEFDEGTPLEVIQWTVKWFVSERTKNATTTRDDISLLSKKNILRIMAHIAVPLAPPIVVLFVGLAVAWVARGFHPTPPAA